MVEQEVPVAAAKETSHPARSWVIGVTSFLFVLLQSVCAAVTALSGLRLLIGVGSLAAAGSAIRALDTIHGAWLRLPMTFLALGGTLVNLYVIWRIRSLRARPSSQWRVGPVDPKKVRAETIQIWLGVATLALLGAEWVTHHRFFGGYMFTR